MVKLFSLLGSTGSIGITSLKIIDKKKYDIIVLKGVLHHTKNPEKILKKLKNILKPNGIIIISEPNLSSIIGNFLKSTSPIIFGVKIIFL